jgi:hypothetical protein
MLERARERKRSLESKTSRTARRRAGKQDTLLTEKVAHISYVPTA